MDEAAKRLIYERNGVGPQKRGPMGSLGSSADVEGRRIIAARNARHGGSAALFGKTAQLAPADVQRLAAMRTNRQARAVLGAVAQALQQGYQATVPWYARAVDKDSRTLQAAMKSRLDGVNKYAQRVYVGLPDNDAPVSDLNRRKVAMVVAQTREAVQDVEQAADASGLAGAFSNALEAALHVVQRDPMRVLKWVGIGVAALLGVYLIHTIVRGVMLGGGEDSSSADESDSGGARLLSLGEAEQAAMALADAKRRKKRTRRVFSIS